MRKQSPVQFALVLILFVGVSISFAWTPVSAQDVTFSTPEKPTLSLRKHVNKDLFESVTPGETLIAPSAAPVNDDIANAVPISALPFQHTVNTQTATVALDDPLMECGNGTNANTVWYRYMPNFTGIVDISTRNSTYDTVLAVFSGQRGSLNLLDCNDDAFDGGQSLVRIEVVANQTYYLEVADYGGANGGTLNFSVDYSPIASLQNAYLGANVLTGENGGLFVVGTTGGDPNASQDDNKRLLFGYPYRFGTSYTTLRIIANGNTTDYALGYEVNSLSDLGSSGSTITTVWEVERVRVSQYLTLVTNPNTNQPDTVEIRYEITNLNTTARQVGLRLLLDTMIGDNDGAPLFVPGFGRITTEQQFIAGAVPAYWIAWESPTFASNDLKARGLLRDSNVTTPNKLLIGHWNDDYCKDAGPGLFPNKWDYQPNSDISILCDSAVALYYDPGSLQPNGSKTIIAHYGLPNAGSGLDLAPDVNNYITANRQFVANISQNAQDVTKVGDYFLDKQTSDTISAIANGVFNGADLLTAGISWAKVGRGLSDIATPGYQAALNASWRGWADDLVAKHWYKPLYDAIHNNRKLLFSQATNAFIQYYGQDIGIEAIKEAEKHLLSALKPGPDTPIADEIGNRMTNLGDGYRTDLLREQDDLVALLAVQSLTPDQKNAYRADMLARQLANQLITAEVQKQRDLLESNHQAALQDENNWLNFWGPLLTKWVVVGGATLAFDGPGFYVASVGTAAVTTVYDAVQDTRQIKHDGKMFDQSLRFLMDRVSSSYIQISQNTVNGLNLIRAGDTPQIAAGNVTVQTMQSFGHYRLWPKLFWAEESSQIGLSINNTTGFATTYYPSSLYTHSSFWSGIEQFYVPGQTSSLAPTNTELTTIPLKFEKGGESPDDNGQVNIIVLGGTETGLYPITTFETTWNPVRVEQNNQSKRIAESFTKAELAAAPTLPYPVISTVSPIQGSLYDELAISVYNPFTLTVQATISQAVPNEFTLIDQGGAEFASNTLTWKAVLEPGQGIELNAVLYWATQPGNLISFPGALLSFQPLDLSTGDTYPTSAQNVAAPWILKVDQTLPAIWKIGEAITLPVTISNLSPNIAASGTMTLVATTPAGDVLATQEVTINIAPNQQQSIVLTAKIANYFGYAAVSEVLSIGNARKEELSQVIWVQGHTQYLPLVSK